MSFGATNSPDSSILVPGGAGAWAAYLKGDQQIHVPRTGPPRCCSLTTRLSGYAAAYTWPT